jgi:predicted O-methyltransferase YrrM
MNIIINNNMNSINNINEENNNSVNNNMIMLLNESFKGIRYRLAHNWFSFVDMEFYIRRPINYLEIGTFYGANLISVANTYGIHNDSKLYCIDPWNDYDEYLEYKNQQSNIYNMFIQNVETSGVKNKIIIKRGYSNIEIPKFQDEMFDIIYIDGNHEPEYVLEDAVLSFRKLKKEGFMIFDDYNWGGPELTKRGIDGFLSGYHKRINILGEEKTQLFIQKKY